MGKDNRIRSIRTRTNEVICDSKSTASNTQEEFRLKSSAAAVAEQRIRDIEDNENQWKKIDLHHQMGEEQCRNLKVTIDLINYV